MSIIPANQTAEMTETGARNLLQRDQPAPSLVAAYDVGSRRRRRPHRADARSCTFRRYVWRLREPSSSTADNPPRLTRIGIQPGAPKY